MTNLIKYKLTITSNNAPINVNMTVSVDNCTSGFIKYCTAVKLVIKPNKKIPNNIIYVNKIPNNKANNCVDDTTFSLKTYSFKN